MRSGPWACCGGWAPTGVVLTKACREARAAEEPEQVDAPEERTGIVGPVDYDRREIDWDCPCLKHAIDGPCGEQFKAAFECFTFSEAEERGSDCIPQFTAMRRCQMDHPEYYKMDDEDADSGSSGDTEADSAEPQAAPQEPEPAQADVRPPTLLRSPLTCTDSPPLLSPGPVLLIALAILLHAKCPCIVTTTVTISP